MKHYRITDDLKRGVNNFLGINYLGDRDIGREIYKLEHYDRIARVSPRKAKLLMATLFPEAMEDVAFLTSHKKEIYGLAKRLHVEKGYRPPIPNWTSYMVRREGLPPAFDEGLKDEDILRGNIVRFR